LDLKVLSNVDYGVAVSDGVLFRIPDETKAYYPGLGLAPTAPVADKIAQHDGELTPFGCLDALPM
jgi:hypothetical protein